MPQKDMKDTSIRFTNFFAGGREKREGPLAEPAHECDEIQCLANCTWNECTQCTNCICICLAPCICGGGVLDAVLDLGEDIILNLVASDLATDYVHDGHAAENVSVWTDNFASEMATAEEEGWSINHPPHNLA